MPLTKESGCACLKLLTAHQLKTVTTSYVVLVHHIHLFAYIFEIPHQINALC